MAGIALLLACLATFIIVGVTLHSAGVGILVTLAVCELTLVLVPAVAAWRAGLGPGALGLRRPVPIFLLAGLVIGASQWFLNLELNGLIEFPDETSEQLRRVAEQPPLGASLLVVCLVPAFCEEVLFRGVFNQALATRWKPAAAVALSAVLFSAYHMSIVQMLPTLSLGIVYGALALRAGSVVPTMIAHLVNNTLALLLAREELPGLYDFVRYHELVALAIAGTATIGGIALAFAFGGTPRLPRATIVHYGDRP